MAVAATAKRWTLEEVHRLPDDGNKYELVRGELFVTPPPSDTHETVHARLNHVLVPYVQAQGLGLVYAGTPCVRRKGSEVLPDLTVRALAPGVKNAHEKAPTPLLVVEVLSRTTRRRDLDQKRRFYMEDARVPEYWAVDPVGRTVRVIRPGHDDRVADRVLVWQPAGATVPLSVDVPALFADL